VNFWFGKLLSYVLSSLFESSSKYFYKCYFLMYSFRFFPWICRRQICKYSGRTITKFWSPLFYPERIAIVVPEELFPTILPITATGGSLWTSEEYTMWFKYKFSSITNHSCWTVTVFLWIESDNLSEIFLKHPQQLFPTVCPANEVPAVLEWEILCFVQNAPANNYLFWIQLPVK
jgi:hypothetical protein